MSDKYKLIIMAEDGRQIEKLFDTREELEAYTQKAIEASGAKNVTLTQSFPESPGMPSVDVLEEVP